jgi:uncharacterized protein (TIGR03083 family)
MPTIVDKSKTVDLLRREFSAIDELCASLTPDQWKVATCLPGWSVQDAVSHIVGTESMLAGVQTPTAAVGPNPDHVKNPVAEVNETWVASMRPLSGAELLARYREITAKRLDSLDAMTQEDFDGPSWTPAGPDETYGRFMRIRHFDCFMHEQDIRGPVGAPLRSDPAAIESSLEEVETSLGYIVGRRASMPEGARVRIDLTGPVERSYLVLVEGRARGVDAFDGPPTVGIELPAMLFLRLTGGRSDANPGPDEIRTSGDRALAEQLASNLAFTI